MNPILHHYRLQWFFRSFRMLFNLLGLLSPVIFISVYMLDQVAKGNPIIFAEAKNSVILFLFALLFIAPICIFTGNYYSEIISDENGLHIKFLWGKLDAPWTDIISLKPQFFFPRQKQIMVIKVRTKSFAIVHRLFAFYHTFSFTPCIIFHKDMLIESDELNRRITDAINRNQVIARAHKLK